MSLIQQYKDKLKEFKEFITKREFYYDELWSLQDKMTQDEVEQLQREVKQEEQDRLKKAYLKSRNHN